ELGTTTPFVTVPVMVMDMNGPPSGDYCNARFATAAGHLARDLKGKDKAGRRGRAAARPAVGVAGSALAVGRIELRWAVLATSSARLNHVSSIGQASGYLAGIWAC